MLLAEFGRLCPAAFRKYEERRNIKLEEGKKPLAGMSCHSAVFLFSLSILCSCALILQSLHEEVWIFGCDTPWLMYFWWGYQGNAVWQSCNIRLLDQKAFCFLFILHTLSQDFTEPARKRGRRREGDRNRRKNRADDGAADRQVEQPAGRDVDGKYRSLCLLQDFFHELITKYSGRRASQFTSYPSSRLTVWWRTGC